MKLDKIFDSPIVINKDNINSVNYDKIIFISYACERAQGSPGEVFSVEKDDNNIKAFRCNHVYGSDILDESEVYNLFPVLNYLYLPESEKPTDWYELNLGLGNVLFVRKKYALLFIMKFKNNTPYDIFLEWQDFAKDLIKTEIQYNNDELEF